LAFRETIGDAIEEDTKKLYPTEAYLASLEEAFGSGRRSTPSLNEFVEKRRAALAANDDVRHPYPTIESVKAFWDSGDPSPKSGEPLSVKVQMKAEPPVGTLLLYWK